MPVYNGMPFVAAAVESVMAQSISNWRLIISDNLSTDGTRGYLEALVQRRDPRIDVFLQSENLGIFGNLNFLFDRVGTRSLVHILCADDVFAEKHSLAALIEFFARESSLPDVVRWNGALLRSQGVPELFSGARAELLFFLYGNVMGNLSCVSCLGDPRRIAGPFDHDFPYVGDFEFWSRLAANGGRLAVLSRDLVVVRSHAGQASNYLSLKGEKYLQQSRVVSRIFDDLSCFMGSLSGFLLRLAGTLIYDSRWRLSALRAAAAGRPEVLNSLNSASAKSSFIFLAPWREIVWLLSFGGRAWKRFIVGISWLVASARLSP